ncbi:unnamed protein product [Macrosiphum euphorbiae]|uniref:LAGLIDADG homing endonuclease n=1 Tax=Macrosiphum euphorbiae TaxID=13131 RepID=A0AAV0WYM2_9HEMI|nr:unnamed protein product [Macrosiphum euphorbiae]
MCWSNKDINSIEIEHNFIKVMLAISSGKELVGQRLYAENRITCFLTLFFKKTHRRHDAVEDENHKSSLRTHLISYVPTTDEEITLVLEVEGKRRLIECAPKFPRGINNSLFGKN